MGTALSPQQSLARPGSRIAGAVWSEVGVARIAIGVVALHVLDDRFVQPSDASSPSSIGLSAPIRVSRLSS